MISRAFRAPPTAESHSWKHLLCTKGDNHENSHVSMDFSHAMRQNCWTNNKLKVLWTSFHCYWHKQILTLWHCLTSAGECSGDIVVLSYLSRQVCSYLLLTFKNSWLVFHLSRRVFLWLLLIFRQIVRLSHLRRRVCLWLLLISKQIVTCVSPQ